MTYLILRLSTLGNVAMTVPVIASAGGLQPQDRFVVVAKKPLGAMFYGLENVTYHEVTATGAWRVWRLWRALQRYGIDCVIDMQDVAQTHLLRFLFRLQRKRIVSIHYGRWQKRRLLLRGAARSNALPTEFDRYAEAFGRAGVHTDSRFTALAVNLAAQQAIQERFGTKTGRWIGIAPFAKSKSNMLPYRVTKEVIERLSATQDTHLFLFGAGKIECEMLRQWASVFPNTTAVAGILPLAQELELMRSLDCMICMDSANQHLSSLVGLRAVSVWCATHPKMGFMGWKQREEDCIQREDIACRPCTCHGRNGCWYRNYACKEIEAEEIIQKMYSSLSAGEKCSTPCERK